MKVPQVLVTLALVSLAVAGAIPKPGEQHKDRVIDKVSVNILMVLWSYLRIHGDATSLKSLVLGVGIR